MKPRLLIVDDEAGIRDLLQRHFESLGCDAMTAGGAEDALVVLAKTRTDIVITDMSMPGMDGVALFEAIRRDYPMIRVIMISGYVAQETILSCMRKGAESFVFKPLVDLKVLERAVLNADTATKHWWRILAELSKAMSEAETVSRA